MQTNLEKPLDEISSFTQEWSILHNDHEKYERYSLLIKLVSLLVCFFALGFDFSELIAIVFIAVIWLQDGIWKTYQARISDRILLIERYIKEQSAGNSDEVAFQFYSEWEKSPRGVKNLLREYGKSSLRPTVAFPHGVLILLQMVSFIFY